MAMMMRRGKKAKASKHGAGQTPAAMSFSGLVRTLVKRPVRDRAGRKVLYAEILKRFKGVLERRAHVSHEFKRPLAAICSALELLTEDAGNRLNAQERFFIDVSLKNARKLSRDIDEKLELASPAHR